MSVREARPLLRRSSVRTTCWLASLGARSRSLPGAVGRSATRFRASLPARPSRGHRNRRRRNQRKNPLRVKSLPATRGPPDPRGSSVQRNLHGDRRAARHRHRRGDRDVVDGPTSASPSVAGAAGGIRCDRRRARPVGPGGFGSIRDPRRSRSLARSGRPEASRDADRCG